MKAELVGDMSAVFVTIGDAGYTEVRCRGEVRFSDGMECGFTYRRQSFMADTRARGHFGGIEQLVFHRKKSWAARGIRKHAFIEYIMRADQRNNLDDGYL